MTEWKSDPLINLRRNGQTSALGPYLYPRVLWEYRFPGRVVAAAVPTANGSVIASDELGSLRVLDAKGNALASLDAGAGLISSPAVSIDGRVVFGTTDHRLGAWKPKHGTIWLRELSSAIRSTPLLAGDRIFVVSDGLLSLNAMGFIQWHHVEVEVASATAALHPKGWILFTSQRGAVLAMDSQGSVIWENASFDSIDAGIAIDDKGNSVVGTDTGWIVSINSNGSIRWRAKTESSIRATAAITHAGSIVVGSHDHYLYQFDSHGALQWKFDTLGRVFASAIVDMRDNIYIGSESGFFFALSKHGKLLWRYSIGQAVFATAALSSDGTLYVGSEDGRLLALR